MSDSERVTTRTWRRPLDEDERVSEAVVEAVATASSDDLESLPPLGDRIDVDALDDLFTPRTASFAAGLVFTRPDSISTELEVRFQYAGYDVTVTDSSVVLN